jgi:hypothetical protein
MADESDEGDEEVSGPAVGFPPRSLGHHRTWVICPGDRIVAINEASTVPDMREEARCKHLLKLVVARQELAVVEQGLQGKLRAEADVFVPSQGSHSGLYQAASEPRRSGLECPVACIRRILSPGGQASIDGWQ